MKVQGIKFEKEGREKEEHCIKNGVKCLKIPSFGGLNAGNFLSLLHCAYRFS